MQIRSILPGACCLGLLAAGGAAHAAALSSSDKEFMVTAPKADMIEAHEGQMAEDQAKSDQVKNYGETLVKDHTANYARLDELASKMGDSIPKGIDAAKEATIEHLARLKGASFDTQFAKDEVAGHRQAIALFKREAAHGQDSDLKAYASDTIPVLEKHLQLAEEWLKAGGHT